MHRTCLLILYTRPGVMTAETLIRPEFDGLWSTVPPASGPLLTGEGGNDFMDSVGRGGMREDGQGCKQTMSKMEKVCVQVFVHA